MGQLRTQSLTASQAGMTRLRDKGGASPNALYELTNGYVAASGAPTQRPGTTWAFNWADPHLSKSSNAGKMKGLVFYNGVFYRFTAAQTGITSGGGSTYVIIPLVHPTNTAATLSKIHFAQPFMGFLYVVAQFSDGYVGHYWLQNPPAWKTGTFYLPSTLIQPTAANGFYYKAVPYRTSVPAWTALLQHNLSDIIQPSVSNGYYYYASHLSSGTGASTTSTGTNTMGPVNSSNTINVAAGTSFATTTGNVVGIFDGFSVLQGTVTSTTSTTLTIKVTDIFLNGSVSGGATLTVQPSATVTQQLNRSGATEPVWNLTAGQLTLDVGAATQPPVAAAAPSLPATTPIGIQPGGKYVNSSSQIP